MADVWRDHPLAPLTTLELGGHAERFVRIDRSEDVAHALAEARGHGPVYVLGGGSNLVVADAGVRGSVLQLCTRGIECHFQEDRAVITAQAGESWQDLVDLALEEDLQGVECLTGIPGRVGATPIQNVGAYGQDVGEVISQVRVLERDTGLERWLSAADCGFGYRDSRFKREPERHIVLAVRFELRRAAAPCLRYAELARVVASSHGPAPSLREVAEVVRTLRAGKSMLWQPDDPNRRCAGSFFTNPVVAAGERDQVLARARAAGCLADTESMPQFPTVEGCIKLAAAWLIERAGFSKGYRQGNVGVSTRHSLALVHHGGGSTAELLALAVHIRDTVEARFGVRLEMEPTCWG